MLVVVLGKKSAQDDFKKERIDEKDDDEPLSTLWALSYNHSSLLNIRSLLLFEHLLIPPPNHHIAFWFLLYGVMLGTHQI